MLAPPRASSSLPLRRSNYLYFVYPAVAQISYRSFNPAQAPLRPVVIYEVSTTYHVARLHFCTSVNCANSPLLSQVQFSPPLEPGVSDHPSDECASGGRQLFFA